MYTPDSSFRTAAIGTPSQWINALANHGADKPAEIATAYFALAPRFGLNADLALAQFCQETGYGTSRRWLQNRNAAGLGATNDGAEGGVWDTITDGITAHYEHLCCYVYILAECPCDHAHLQDTRHWFHDGIAALSTLERPPFRQWAYPGTNYLAAILAIANSVVPQVVPPGGHMQPTEADIGYPVEYHPAQAHGPDHPISDIKWFVVHDTQGGYLGSLSVLTGPNVSAHALIRRDGLLAYLLPLTQGAWAAGNLPVNNQAVQVELENADYATNDYTDAQYRSLAAFFRWCVGQGMNVPATYIGRVDADGGLEPDIPGILGHQDVPDGHGGWGGSDHHTDPGPPFQWDTLIGYIGGAPPQPQDTFVVDGNPHGAVPVKTPLWNRWHYLDTLGLALPMIGYPLAAETVLPDGRRAQQFERAWLAVNDAQNPWDVTALLLVEIPS